jgi:hypothetical protein
LLSLQQRIRLDRSLRRKNNFAILLALTYAILPPRDADLPQIAEKDYALYPSSPVHVCAVHSSD